MSEFVVGDYSYVTTRMPVRAQFHVARRLAPLLGTLGPALRAIPRSAPADVDTSAPAVDDMLMATVFPLFANALAEMTTEHCDFIIDTCLKTVQRVIEGGRSSAVMTDRGALMFKDIDLMQMMQMAFEVLKEAIGPFFSGALSGSQATIPAV